MSEILELRLSIDEILSAIGVLQCIFVMVYMAFRAGKISRASIAFVFFFILGISFYIDLSEQYVSELFRNYDYYTLLSWYSIPPLSILLMVQISNIHKLPAKRFYLYLLIIPAIIATAHFVIQYNESCSAAYMCDEHVQLLKILIVIFMSLALLSLWLVTDIFHFTADDHYKAATKERFWLIVAIIFLNAVLIALLLLELIEFLSVQDTNLVKTLVGIGFVYLASTSLFRIYPQAVQIIDKTTKNTNLSVDDQILITGIEHLLNVEKVYQEPSYGRQDIARELSTSESTVSRVVSSHYQKSIPQLLNDHRLKEAKQLLIQTNENINLIVQETGFNSISSFNRVFKQSEGLSPTQYRNQFKLK